MARWLLECHTSLFFHLEEESQAPDNPVSIHTIQTLNANANARAFAPRTRTFLKKNRHVSASAHCVCTSKRAASTPSVLTEAPSFYHFSALTADSSKPGHYLLLTQLRAILNPNPLIGAKHDRKERKSAEKNGRMWLFYPLDQTSAALRPNILRCTLRYAPVP